MNANDDTGSNTHTIHPLRFVWVANYGSSPNDPPLETIRAAGVDWVIITRIVREHITRFKDAGFSVAAGFPNHHPKGGPRNESIAPHDIYARKPIHPNVYSDDDLIKRACDALASCREVIDAVIIGTDHGNEISFPTTAQKSDVHSYPYHVIDAGRCGLMPLWTEWLSLSYGAIDAFNALHLSNYSSFDLVPCPPSPDDCYDYRAFVDWLVVRALDQMTQTVGRIAPSAERWLAPCVEIATIRAPFPFFSRLDHLRSRWPDLGLCIYGGAWIKNGRHDLTSVIASYLRFAKWKIAIAGCNGIDGLINHRAGERLLAMGVNGIVCGLHKDNDLGLLASEINRLREMHGILHQGLTSP